LEARRLRSVAAVFISRRGYCRVLAAWASSEPPCRDG
jgi:hypothetical protein